MTEVSSQVPALWKLPMTYATGLHIDKQRWSCLGSIASPLCLALATLAILLSPNTATAQDSGVQNAQPVGSSCRVFSDPPANDGRQQLIADCRGRGLLLGDVTKYDVVANELLGIVLIDAWLDTTRRVWLLSMKDDGTPFVEDLSGTIARAAARGSSSSIADITLMTAQFASTGSIDIKFNDNQNKILAAMRLDLGQMVAEEHRRSIKASAE